MGGRPRPPPGHGSGGADERLDRARVDQGTVQTQDAAEGDQVVLEPEFVRPLEPDPVDDPDELLRHVPEGDALDRVGHCGHEGVV
jgi:hypothetical protein